MCYSYIKFILGERLEVCSAKLVWVSVIWDNEFRSNWVLTITDEKVKRVRSSHKNTKKYKNTRNTKKYKKNALKINKKMDRKYIKNIKLTYTQHRVQKYKCTKFRAFFRLFQP